MAADAAPAPVPSPTRVVVGGSWQSGSTWRRADPRTRSGELALSGGEIGTSRLQVSVPVGQCDAAGTYPLTLSAVGSTLGLLGETPLTLDIVPTPPELGRVMPAANARVGGEAVLFSWRTPVAGVTSVAIAGGDRPGLVRVPCPPGRSN